MENISPRQWYYQNQKAINDLGFSMCRGDGPNIGLEHKNCTNEFGLYWYEEDAPDVWYVSTLYNSEIVLDAEAETLDEVMYLLSNVSKNIDAFNTNEDNPYLPVSF